MPSTIPSSGPRRSGHAILTEHHRDILLPAACTQPSLALSAHRTDAATLLLSRCNALLTRRPGGPNISRISPDAGRPESQFFTAMPRDGELRRDKGRYLGQTISPHLLRGNQLAGGRLFLPRGRESTQCTYLPFSIATIHSCRSARELEHFRRNFVDAIKVDAPEFHACLETTPPHAAAGRYGPLGARVSGVRAINGMSSSTIEAWSTGRAQIASSSAVSHFALATRGFALAAQFFRRFAAVFRHPARRPDHVSYRGPHGLRHHHVPY